MIRLIKCWRCPREIVQADVSNADYILGDDGVGHIICPDCYQDSDTLIWGVHKVLQTGELPGEPAPSPVLKKPGILKRLFGRFLK